MNAAFAIPRAEAHVASRILPLLRILIVEEQRPLRETYREYLAILGYEVIACESSKHASRLIDTQSIDVAFISMQAGRTGFSAIQEMKRSWPDTEIVVISSDARVESVVAAMKAGAYSYLSKPFHVQQLQNILQQLTTGKQLLAGLRRGGEGLLLENAFASFAHLGHSPAMRTLYKMSEKCARSSHPVLIVGESGTGKELLARAIHDAGPHPEEPFIVVDCQSVDPSHLERSLFGWDGGQEGSSYRSVFERAGRGTTFLANIEKLSTDLQSKILRVLTNKQVQPMGGAQPREVGMRFIAGAEGNLRSLVNVGTFIRDLYYALSVLTLRIPPLRERPDDIAFLAQEFVTSAARKSDRWLHLSAEAIRTLMAHNWPGNLRELQYCVAAATHRCSGTVIRPCDLEVDLLHASRHSTLNHPADVVPLYELERAAILAALTGTGGDKVKAAAQLGIGKTTLYRKIREYGVKL